MLGKLVYEGKGKIIGMKVLENGGFEQTAAMMGLLLGEEFTATWTQQGKTDSDMTGFGKASGFFTTKDGSSGRYDIISNYTVMPEGSMAVRGAVCYHCPPGKHAFLNGIAVVYEMEFDKDGNFISKGWEWK